MARYGSRASNLTGLLGSIGDTIGEMGQPGHQYVDTFRRTMAPKVDTNSSQSMKDYSLWARRNGYDDEAVRYENMAIERQKVEGMQDFKKANLTDSSIMRKIHEVDTSAMSAEQKAALNQAYELAESRMNQRGADYENGKGTEGSDMTNVLLAEDAAKVKLARDIEAHNITLQKEQDRLDEQRAAGQIMPEDSLTEEEYAVYLRAMNAAPSDAARAKINEVYKERFTAHRKMVESGAKAQAVMDVTEVVSDLANSDKNTKWLGLADGPLSSWMEDNPELVKAASEATKEALAGNPEYVKAGPEERKAIASKTLREYLKEVSPNFKEADTSHRYDLMADEAAAMFETQFANRYWARGLEPGGAAYRQAIENRFRRQNPTAEDYAEFNKEWDNATKNSADTASYSPMNEIRSAGIYK